VPVAVQALIKVIPISSKCESGEQRVDVLELNKFAKLYKKDFEYFV